MDANRILDTLETLSLADLHRIRAKADELISTIEAWQQPDQAEHTTTGKTYRQEYTKCNKPNCKTCTAGPGHGPYWYAYWREGTKLHKQYIGKNYHEI